MDYRKNSSKNSGMAPTQVLIKASEEWKSMSAKAKQAYEKKATANVSTYRKEFEKYTKSGRLDAWKRDPDRPRRPLTPYTRFVVEQKEKSPALTFNEIATQWNKLTAKKKAPMEKAFAADQAKYREQLANYSASGKEEKWKAKVGIKALEDEEAAKKERVQAKLREKIQAQKDKAKARTLKAKLAEKKQAQKEKAKARALAAKAKLAEKKQAQKEKAKARALAAKAKLAEKKQAQKEKAKVRALERAKAQVDKKLQALKKGTTVKAKIVAHKKKEKARA